MTRFTITFAVSLPTNSGKDAAEGKEKRSPTELSKERNKRQPCLPAEVQQKVIELGKLLTEMHVEYELVPGHKFHLDCRCWQAMAKVYMADGVLLINPTYCPEYDNTMWIIFSVHHTLDLNLSELQQLFKHTIVSTLTFGSAKLSNKAKRDLGKKVFVTGRLAHRTLVLDAVPVISSLQSVLDDEALIKKPKYPSSYVDSVPDAAHVNRLFNLLKRTTPSLSPKTPTESALMDSRILETAPLAGNEKEINEKELTEKTVKMKNIKNASYQLPVSGNALFAVTTSTVSSISVIVNSEDILKSKEIRKLLNPLSIKLDKLENFPHDAIVGERFAEIYAKMILADVTIITPRLIPNTTLYFDYIKCFLTVEFQPDRLISFLTTENFVVEIYGTLNVKAASTKMLSPKTERTTRSSMKSQSRIKKSKNQPSSVDHDVLLGLAYFDLSDLLRGCWEVSHTNGLIHPQNLPFASELGPTEDTTSIRDSPLTCETFISNSTSVEVKVRLASSLGKEHGDARRRANALNRMVLILCDKDLGNDVLDDVHFRTKEVLNTDRVITGFAIDCVDRLYIFCEGLINGSYLHKIWEKVMTLDVAKGCVLYNSDFVFLSRLYQDFLPVGLVRINLREPLEDQLRECGLYVGNTSTTSRARVLKSVGLMKLTSTMRSLCQSHLLPRASVVTDFDLRLAETYLTTNDYKQKEEKDCSTKSTGQHIMRTLKVGTA